MFRHTRFNDCVINTGMTIISGTFTNNRPRNPPDLDPFFEFVTLVYRGNGADGDNADDDGELYISTSATVDYFSAAELSNTQTRATMNTSLYIPGADDDARIIPTSSGDEDALYPNNADDFTMELWAYPTTVTNTMRFCGFRGSGAGELAYEWRNNPSSGTTPSFQAAFWTVTTGFITLTDGTGANYSTNEWTHFCVEREGTTLSLYINGVLIDTDTSIGASETIGDTNAADIPHLSIGQVGYTPSEAFNGYIDSFRITQGVARYAGAFTPPTAPFPIT